MEPFLDDGGFMWLRTLSSINKQFYELFRGQFYQRYCSVKVRFWLSRETELGRHYDLVDDGGRGFCVQLAIRDDNGSGKSDDYDDDDDDVNGNGNSNLVNRIVAIHFPQIQRPRNRVIKFSVAAKQINLLPFASWIFYPTFRTGGARLSFQPNFEFWYFQISGYISRPLGISKLGVRRWKETLRAAHSAVCALYDLIGSRKRWDDNIEGNPSTSCNLHYDQLTGSVGIDSWAHHHRCAATGRCNCLFKRVAFLEAIRVALSKVKGDELYRLPRPSKARRLINFVKSVFH